MSFAISSAFAPLVSICLASGDRDDSALADDAYMAAAGVVCRQAAGTGVAVVAAGRL